MNIVRKNLHNISSLILIILILNFLTSYGGHAVDEQFNLYSTFIILKDEYPDFLQRLKNSWPNEEDTEIDKENKIALFLKDLDDEIRKDGPINELNFNSILYDNFKTVVYRKDHRSILRALLRGFSEEIEYIDDYGKLHPNLYPLRDAVKKSLLTRTVEDILELDSVRVKCGTRIEEIELPDTVRVLTSNEYIEEIPVKWDLKTSSLNSEQVGEYEVTGRLDLTKYNYVLPTNKIVTVTVRVMPYITEILVENISIEYGEELSTNLLPEEVKIKLNDGGIVTEHSVTWDIVSFRYDKYMPGIYYIVGNADISTKHSYIYYDNNIIDIEIALEVRKPMKMPGGGMSLIGDNQGYYLRDRENSYLMNEVRNKISSNDRVLIKLSDNIFIDKNGMLVNVDEIPQIYYLFNEKISCIYSDKDGYLLTD